MRARSRRAGGRAAAGRHPQDPPVFRQADERVNERDLDRMTVDCRVDSLEDTEWETTVGTLQSLPLHHLIVLAAAVGSWSPNGEIAHSVRTSRLRSCILIVKILQ